MFKLKRFIHSHSSSSVLALLTICGDGTVWTGGFWAEGKGVQGSE